ncbi:MAG: cache domain-containing protein [Sneathiella sp.]
MFRSLSFGIAMIVLLVSGGVQAEDKKSHVSAMMEKAVQHYKSAGEEQAFSDFSKKGSEYFNGEYYVIAQSLEDDKITFHPVNAKLVGKNLTKVKDTDGVAFVGEMSAIAKGAGNGWVSYKWPHPETKKIAQKHTLVNRVGDIMLMIGYYE